MTDRDYLFSKYDLRLVLENLDEKLKRQIDGLTQDALFGAHESPTIAAFEKEFTVYELTLSPDQVTMDQQETQVDVRNDPMRFVIDRTMPAYVPGFAVRYFVPYVGDKWLWETRPSQFTFSPPAAKITDTEMILEYTVPGSDIAQTKNYYTNALSSIQQWIEFQKPQIHSYNQQLRAKIVGMIANRRSRLEKVKEQAGSLGIPLRKKAEPTAGEAAATMKSSKSTLARPTQMYDVALSFAGEDREYVEQVAATLKNMKVSVFYDKFEETKLWGTNLLDYLSNVYGKQSRFVVMFVSKHYATKAWPTVERQTAQARAIRENKIVVLPARFDDTELPGLPSTVAYIDLRKRSSRELAEIIRQKLAENA